MYSTVELYCVRQGCDWPYTSNASIPSHPVDKVHADEMESLSVSTSVARARLIARTSAPLMAAEMLDAGRLNPHEQWTLMTATRYHSHEVSIRLEAVHPAAFSRLNVFVVAVPAGEAYDADMFVHCGDGFIPPGSLTEEELEYRNRTHPPGMPLLPSKDWYTQKSSLSHVTMLHSDADREAMNKRFVRASMNRQYCGNEGVIRFTDVDKFEGGFLWVLTMPAGYDPATARVCWIRIPPPKETTVFVGYVYRRKWLTRIQRRLLPFGNLNVGEFAAREMLSFQENILYQFHRATLREWNHGELIPMRNSVRAYWATVLRRAIRHAVETAWAIMKGGELPPLPLRAYMMLAASEYGDRWYLKRKTFRR